MPFFSASRETAINYLSTVLTVDDMLGFGPQETLSEEDFIPEDDDATEYGVADIDNNNNEETPLADHYLDYQELSKSFASFGLHCSGLKPDTTKPVSDVVDDIILSANKSDLCIFDWEMEALKDGSTAKSVIEKLVANDYALNGRLRLVVIYTGVDQAKHRIDIIDPIARLIETKLNGISSHTVKVTDQHVDICDQDENCSWRVVCVGKGTVDPSQLANITIDEFVDLTAGLLSNATLASIAELRLHTNSLLYKFNKNLDFAFISHVLGLMSSPLSRGNANNVSIDYAIDLVSEEIKSLLQNSSLLKDEFKEERMSKWPKFKNSNDQVKYLLEYSDKSHELTADELLSVMNISNQSDEDYDTILNGLQITKSKFKNSAISLSLKGDDAKLYLEKLSSIEGVRRSVCSHKTSTPISLKQGTILEINDMIFVCIQPLCDSVRLQDNTDFVFLKSVFDETDGKFTHVVKHEDEYIKLYLVPGKNGVHNFTFKPDANRGEIISVFENEKHFFNAEYNLNGIVDIKIKLRWLGELKSNVAQSLCTNLASQLSRVGLDTNEWLRLQ
ncbi:response regulator receiver domain [Photobacterium sp.]|uniref:response regulator receiver domain n=1 Tax=Photobacterium sp. TaxID=660 RepID=UPI00299EFD98|nr:response regulator receiver domain [Photobacterium sp.]MDX1300926.1 response regulator receiver domain [Photobacterium sp.]